MNRRNLPLFLGFCLLAAAPLAADETIGIAFWNVENLFDTHDDPLVAGDEEFTPAAPKKWSEERLCRKLDNLASVISGMFAGKGPDVLGLSEIENRAVIERLVFRLQHLGRHYEIVHQDSPSGRGIDCALIYDARLFELKRAAYHQVGEQRTREIVEAELSREGDVLTVFVNHWPARAHPASERIQAASVLRGRIDSLLSGAPQADIVVIGDLNDHVDDDSILLTLRAQASADSLAAGDLLNSTADLPDDGPPGTYVYRNHWDVIDHVILSAGLLDEQGFRWQSGSTRPLLILETQLFHPRQPNIPRPNRSYSWDRFHPDGFSDHLPVGCVLQR